uniref:Cytochrome P450 51 n=1 Tax=Ganoderma boninense TaxID=34458 RepID=A0A5K1K5F9_9APHY|nr:Cytochrome P450 51 [Ganoderma boninense]
MSDNGRPLKRARISETASSPDVPESSTSANLPHLFEPHHEFWLPDGNIILVARAIGFRIYRGLIAAQSTVFEDMFASSSTDANEIFDGCPVVHLSDSPEDLVHLVRVLLPKSQRLYNRPASRPFSEISALVRLAHKYHIQDVQDQALASLQGSVLSSHFEDWFKESTMPIIDNIDMIGIANLARLTDTLSMLPGALFVCTLLSPGELLRGLTREDGTVEHLSADDLRRCLEGQRTLAIEVSLLPSRIFARTPAVGCSTPAHCQPWCLHTLVCIVSSENIAARQTSLGSWRNTIVPPASDGGMNTAKLCGACEKELLRRDRHERWKVWKRLPEIFGIDIEGWGTGADVVGARMGRMLSRLPGSS